MATKPTHEQAQLHLQVYDLRREARLRQARDWFAKNYFVENLEDFMRLAAPGSGSASSRSLHRFASGSQIRCSSRTWKKPRSASHRGARAALPVISRPCGK